MEVECRIHLKIKNVSLPVFVAYAGRLKRWRGRLSLANLVWLFCNKLHVRGASNGLMRKWLRSI